MRIIPEGNHNRHIKKSFLIIIVTLSFAMLTSTSIFAISSVNAQTSGQQPPSSSATNNSAQVGQLKFFLKLANSPSNSGQQQSNNTASSPSQTQGATNTKKLLLI